ncbi:MAG: Zn-dependent hydrolase [Desulfobacula sp.]|jgi:beta-ureidopropionase / N-carbamoyl-L-amino-acid hydrolase|uniref:Zn-dependent hydrolase n=2 Tax=Desulfobacula sp. TaxID=2593537 RepID=UPI001DCE4219|nr:Zn-dependent hydrolase [Desulfobacula sp.]MBT4023961.1 Zn-dependent hydrolase [Desulfobacula sp.]MBT5970540.1 Zn-dependent hydrolase [Desulfobacula sp.]
MGNHQLRVNGKRLQNTLEEMAKIGATPNGGVQRLALSDEDKQARDLFVKWLKQLDLEVSIDELGNIFGKRDGINNDLAPVMSGSHIDSQPKGGRFDGILGVMGPLEAIRTLNENNIKTNRPITIVAWTNEEGTRFAPAMMCSGVWANALDINWIYDRTDINGLRFEDELIRIGYKGKIPAKKSPIHAYYEYHIEQGPLLEKQGITIGAPKGIVCLHWYDIYLEGEANQVGPTPMEGRHDALCAAAEMILKVNELPERMNGNLVATVGEIQNEPNSRNIIPDKVHFTVDIRSWDDNLAIKAWDLVKKDFQQIAQQRGCPIRIEETWRVEHSPFDKKLVQNILDTADNLGYSSLHMVSGAGHDASYMNQIAPTAMIFVPSIGGRSHVEVENTKWEDCEAGTNVLLHSILNSAQE